MTNKESISAGTVFSFFKYFIEVLTITIGCEEQFLLIKLLSGL